MLKHLFYLKEMCEKLNADYRAITGNSCPYYSFKISKLKEDIKKCMEDNDAE